MEQVLMEQIAGIGVERVVVRMHCDRHYPASPSTSPDLPSPVASSALRCCSSLYPLWFYLLDVLLIFSPSLRLGRRVVCRFVQAPGFTTPYVNSAAAHLAATNYAAMVSTINISLLLLFWIFTLLTDCFLPPVF